MERPREGPFHFLVDVSGSVASSKRGQPMPRRMLHILTSHLNHRVSMGIALDRGSKPSLDAAQHTPSLTTQESWTRSVAAASLAAVLLVFLAYSNSFRNSFHFDDSHVIVDNLFIRSLANIPRF